MCVVGRSKVVRVKHLGEYINILIWTKTEYFEHPIFQGKVYDCVSFSNSFAKNEAVKHKRPLPMDSLVRN